jgi:hypothetical protein
MKRPRATKPATPARSAQTVENSTKQRKANADAACGPLSADEATFVASIHARLIPANEKTHWCIIDQTQRAFHCTMAERARLDALVKARGVSIATLLRAASK